MHIKSKEAYEQNPHILTIVGLAFNCFESIYIL